MCVLSFLQLEAVDSQEALNQLFGEEECSAALVETGYRKPPLLVNKEAMERTLCPLPLTKGACCSNFIVNPP